MDSERLFKKAWKSVKTEDESQAKFWFTVGLMIKEQKLGRPKKNRPLSRASTRLAVNHIITEFNIWRRKHYSRKGAIPLEDLDAFFLNLLYKE